MPYGIEPLADAVFLNDLRINANIGYLQYGHYMLEITASKDIEHARTAIEINYCPKCGRPLFQKHKGA